MNRTRSGRSRSPLIAALASAIIPGAGHLYAGYRRTGWLLIAFSLLSMLPAILLAAALFVTSDIGIAITVAEPFLEHPILLLGLLVVNGAMLAFRIAAIAEAYRITAGRHRPAGWHVAATATLMVALVAGVAAPHAWAAHRNLALYDLATYDFTADPGFGDPAPTTTAPRPVPGDTSTTSSTAPQDPFDPPQPTATTTTTAPVATTTPAPTTTSSTTTPPPAALTGADGRFTVALLGGDAGRGRVGIRTDTIIVVTAEPGGDEAAMFSIPRNLRRLPIPAEHPAHDAWGCGCVPGLANTIYAEGLANPGLFPGGPNPGINAVKAVIGNLLDLEIDKVVLVALDGFVDLIDALGGVDITVVKPVNDPKQVQPDGSLRDIVIPPGDHHFDGLTALAYARVRQQDSDYYRMDRQRCLLEAVADQFDAVTLLRRLPDLTAAARASLVMDLHISDLTTLIEWAGRIDTGAVVSLRFVPDAPDLAGTGLSYVVRAASGTYPVANVDLIRERVQIALSAPPAEAVISLTADTLDGACSVP